MPDKLLNPDVGMISFIGSTPVGRRIGEVCGRMLQRTALELVATTR